MLTAFRLCGEIDNDGGYHGDLPEDSDEEEFKIGEGGDFDESKLKRKPFGVYQMGFDARLRVMSRVR